MCSLTRSWTLGLSFTGWMLCQLSFQPLTHLPLIVPNCEPWHKLMRAGFVLEFQDSSSMGISDIECMSDWPRNAVTALPWMPNAIRWGKCAAWLGLKLWGLSLTERLLHRLSYQPLTQSSLLNCDQVLTMTLVK